MTLGFSLGCSGGPEFFRVPLTEGTARSFIVRFEGGGVVASPIPEGEALLLARPETRPIYWLALPEGELTQRMDDAKTATVAWTLGDIGCDGEFSLPDDRVGVFIRRHAPRFARLGPEDPAFVPLDAAEIAPESELGRLAVTLRPARGCRLTEPPGYRSLAFELPALSRIAELTPVSDRRLVILDGAQNLLFLVGRESSAPLDVLDLGALYGPSSPRPRLVTSRSGTRELLVTTEDRSLARGRLLAIPVGEDRFGTPRVLFDEEVLNGVAEEPDGALVVNGRRGLVGIQPTHTATFTVERPYPVVDMEGLAFTGRPYHYVISDGAGRLHQGDVRTPSAMRLRIFVSLGLRETHWFETPTGPRIYARDHSDRLFSGSGDGNEPASLWEEGQRAPPELRGTCREERDRCGNARVLSPVYRFERLESLGEAPPRLLVSYLSCLGATVLEPSTGCTFGLTPPGLPQDRVRSLVRWGEEHLVLLESGAVYAVDLR